MTRISTFEDQFATEADVRGELNGNPKVATLSIVVVRVASNLQPSTSLSSRWLINSGKVGPNNRASHRHAGKLL